MNYLQKFENFKYESVNESVFPELAALSCGLFALLPLALDLLDITRNHDEDKEFLVKPFQKVANFFKTAPVKIKNSFEDAASSIQSIGMEDDAVKWITDNIINNKELQEELKSIEAKVEEINSEMSVLNKRKERSVSLDKSHHLDQLKSNNQKLLNSLEEQKKSVAMRAKGLLKQLQLDNKPLYKALMSSMEKLKQDNQLLSIMTERFRINI
jgi:hypothetical protein